MSKLRRFCLIIPMLTLLLAAWADSYHLVIHSGYHQNTIDVDSIDSITFSELNSVYAHLKDSTIIAFHSVDSITMCESVSDTLFVIYEGSHAFVNNPHGEAVVVCQNDSNADILLHINKKYTSPVISVSGNTGNGRLRVDSEVDYTLILNGVSIASAHAPAINSISKQKVTLIIEEGTENYLSDIDKYIFEDTTEISNGCFCTMGALSVTGKGHLSIKGNKKHALYAKKSITIKDGTLTVPHAISDAIHSGKNVTIDGGELHLIGMQGDGIDLDDDFNMTGGIIEMNIDGDAAKGIKCGKQITIEGGNISATASGALKNKEGELAYCTILKCDSNMTVTGGEFNLVNNSPGGKCISAAHNLEISGGSFYLETNGDGAEYTNAQGETDYYTSKCLAADDTLLIHRGNIKCLSSGLGGKGIVADEYMEVGSRCDTMYNQGPTIEVHTQGMCIVNNIDEDQRFGCPKAIKVDSILTVYSGYLYLSTDSMGGEGIECNDTMYVYGGHIESNAYDDGINVLNSLQVYGGAIYCSSIDNDGIDSNGEIVISGGIVSSVNYSKPNESFDTEKRQLHITGGTVFGIGSSMVKIGDSSLPFYNTLYNNSPDKPIQRGLRLTTGKYVYIMNGSNILMALKNDNLEYQTFLTVVHSDFDESTMYGIFEGDQPTEATETYFHDKLIMGGQPQNEELIIYFTPTRVIE